MLLSLLKDLSNPKHQFQRDVIPCSAVTVGYVSHDAAYNDLMKVILKLMFRWLFGLDERGTKGMPVREVKGCLLSDQPFKSHPSHANNQSDAFHQVLCDITAFHKTVVTFTLLLTLSLHCTTGCHYRHTLSSSTRSIELLLRNIFRVAAGLSVSVCACIYL